MRLRLGLCSSIHSFSATAFPYAVSGLPLRSRAVYNWSAPDSVMRKIPNFALMELEVRLVEHRVNAESNILSGLAPARGIVANVTLHAEFIEEVANLESKYLIRSSATGSSHLYGVGFSGLKNLSECLGSK